MHNYLIKTRTFKRLAKISPKRKGKGKRSKVLILLKSRIEILLILDTAKSGKKLRVNTKRKDIEANKEKH